LRGANGQLFTVAQEGPAVVAIDTRARAVSGRVTGGNGPDLRDAGNDDLILVGDSVWVSRFNRGDLIEMPLP
jgi:hypothetical protein